MVGLGLMDDDLEPIAAPQRGRPRKKRKEVMPDAAQLAAPDRVMTGVQPTVQTAAAPVLSNAGSEANIPAQPRVLPKGTGVLTVHAPTVEEVVAAYRAQQPVAGAPPQVPEVLSHDPGSVPRETSDIEAELARRRGATKPLSEMSEAELEAELARRRGQTPPVATPGDIRMGDNAPAPVFSVSPAAEAQRIAAIAGGRLVETASPQPNLNPEGGLIAPRQFNKDPRTWPNGEQRIHDPFAPAIVQDEPEPGYVEAEVTLKDGSKTMVKVPLSVVQTVVAEAPPPDEGMTRWRCLQDGTPGGGGYVPSGCPDFWAERVPGVHVRCPRCHSKTVWEMAD